MKLIEFPEQTVVIAKNQKEYNPLPAHVYEGDPQGRIAFCWKLHWWERLAVLVSGEIWAEVLTFKQPLQPQLLSVEKPAMRLPFTEETKDWRWGSCLSCGEMARIIPAGHVCKACFDGVKAAA